MVTEKRKSRLQLFNSDVVFFRFQLGPDTQTAYEHHSCVRFFSIDQPATCVNTNSEKESRISMIKTHQLSLDIKQVKLYKLTRILDKSFSIR